MLRGYLGRISEGGMRGQWSRAEDWRLRRQPGQRVDSAATGVAGSSAFHS